MTYTDDAAEAARAMWKKGLSAHQVRAALEKQHPRSDGWTVVDVHRAVIQRQRDIDADAAWEASRP